MNGWNTATLGAVSHVITKGTTPSIKDGGFSVDGIAFFKVESITETGNIDGTRVSYITEETHRRLKRSILQENDLLFSIAGTIGKVAHVRDIHLPANTNQALAIIRPNTEKVDVRFLMYTLRDKRNLDRALSRTVQSVQANLSLTELSSMEFLLPPWPTQTAIAEVLGALDDKIAANTQLIATIDSLAQAQFHAALHDSQPQPLSSLANFVNGKAFTKGASGTGRVVVRIAELNSGIGKSTVFSDAEVDDKHVARPGDILFAWSGSLTLHRWFRDEAIVNQHIFKVIPNEGIADWLIYELLRNKIEDFKMIAADKATTMGHIQRKHLDELVLVPSEVAQGEIAPLMESLWQTALTAERENLTLAATRDALLPQLMSGKLRVKDAEPALEDVL